ncbi:MAG: LamG domain-containing protein [Planctomycetota bacterium]
MLRGVTVVATCLGSLLALCLSAGWASEPEEGSIAYWPFDEGSGSVAHDLSGNGHDLALDGASWSEGMVGAWALDTRAGYGITAHSNDLELSESYTIAAWIWHDTEAPGLMTIVASNHWCGIDDDGSWEVAFRPGPDGSFSLREFARGYGRGSWYGTTGARIGGEPYDPDWGDIGAPPVELPAREWTHVAVTYDDLIHEASVYVNGELVRRGPWISELGGGQAPFTVGTDHLLPWGGLCGSNHFLPADIDELRIYSKALSESEIGNLVFLTAVVDIDPDSLNMKSRGQFVTAYIELPVGHDPQAIIIETILLNEVVPALPWPWSIGDYDGDSVPDLMVKFDRQAVIDALPRGPFVEVTVTGDLVTGFSFSGTDTICVF